jgi:hypothetical protein
VSGLEERRVDEDGGVDVVLGEWTEEAARDFEESQATLSCPNM